MEKNRLINNENNTLKQRVRYLENIKVEKVEHVEKKNTEVEYQKIVFAEDLDSFLKFENLSKLVNGYVKEHPNTFEMEAFDCSEYPCIAHIKYQDESSDRIEIIGDFIEYTNSEYKKNALNPLINLRLLTSFKLDSNDGSIGFVLQDDFFKENEKQLMLQSRQRTMEYIDDNFDYSNEE